MIARSLRPFLLACQFLTVIPLPATATPDGEDIGQSSLYYPLIGLLLGLSLSATAYVSNLLFTHILSAVLVLTIWVILTGALHLDGFADSVDGWAGGLGSGERTLRIMKDPHCGPMAVTALVLLLLIKAATLAALLMLSGNLLLLLIPPVLARLSILVLFLTTPYVRPLGLGEVLINHFPRRTALAICLLLPTFLLLAAFSLSLKIILVSGLSFLMLRRMMITRIGGCTGDTTGALVEMLEVGVLLTMVAHYG
ncbi:MAG: adenosylcobinamide-GDP ribazoletransferase [Pseudomonadales bacterium]